MCASLPSLDRLFHAMCSLLGQRLQELGVLSSHSTEDELSRVSKMFSHGFLEPSHMAFNKLSIIGACYFHVRFSTFSLHEDKHKCTLKASKSIPDQVVFESNLVL
jgi:hypothetical protein